MELTKNQKFQLKLFTLPEQNGEKEYTKRVQSSAFLETILTAFMGVLLTALERRMNACVEALMANKDNVAFNDGQHIEWPTGQFNIPSYEAMEHAIECIQKKDWKFLLYSKSMLEQTIKALLEDTDHPTEVNGYTISQLSSILLRELTAVPQPLTREQALAQAAQFGLENEVREEMDKCASPEEALEEWLK